MQLEGEGDFDVDGILMMMGFEPETFRSLA